MARLRSLPLIVFVALLLRVGFLYDYVTHHVPRALSTIPFLFEPGNIAASLVNGHGFANPFRVETGPTAWMTPIYPLILAAIFKLFGTYTIQAFLAATGLNVLLSTLTCIPIYAAARRMFGTGVAAGAAWLWAIFPNAIILTYESLFEGSLSAFLAATLLWSLLRTADSDSPREWAFHGLLWGGALMANASFVTLLPFLFGWTEYRAHQRPRFSFTRPALAAVLAILCCAPWAIRNYLEFHDFVPLRTVGGLALWLGNNEQASSRTPAGLHPIDNQAERDHYVEVGELEYMREKQSLALDYLFTHPAVVIRMTTERFTGIWTGGSVHPLDDLIKARNPRFHLVVFSNLFAAFGTLAAILILFRKRSPFFLPLAVFPVVFPLVYYFALATPRYRHPIDPVIVLLTAFAISQITPSEKIQTGGPPASRSTS